MNKKFLGIKIATYLQAIVCVIVAVSIWLFANYTTHKEAPQAEEAAIVEFFEKV
ncbi:MAG: hypothetical protein J6Q68_02795 [Clostridia bacterium]|nr:hypothetical protein [Clostridia bacterium]